MATSRFLAQSRGPIAACLVMLSGAVAALWPDRALSQPVSPSIEELLASVVKVKAHVPAGARSAETLGREREGTGVVIDQNGLVLTIGYLILEATSAEVIDNAGKTRAAEVAGYDHETGFGLLRVAEPLKVKPMALGTSRELTEKDPVLVASFGGREMAGPAYVVSVRTFAGSWEYLLENAIFTAPPHPAWSGAALINRSGRLVGIGSLIVGDAMASGQQFPGNMFVPIDALKPILSDLIADGRAGGPGKPWLGLTTEEVQGRLFVTRVAPDSPAAKVGIKRGDIVLGIGDKTAASLVELYQLLHGVGAAGVSVPLTVLQGNQLRRIDIPSVNRADYLRARSTL